jgi:hypothetical protein
VRIHTDTLAYRDFFDAQDTVKRETGAPVFFHGETSLPRYRSRPRRQAYVVKLASDGTLTRRRVNYGTARYADRFDRPFSATWDQWGWFLAHLFTVDPDAIAGPYNGADDFHTQTRNAYAGTPATV